MGRRALSALFVSLALLSSCTSARNSGLVGIESIDHLYEVLDEDEVSFVYFGRPTCPDCQDFIVILEEVIEENSLTVYYFNTDAMRDEEEYDEVIDIFHVF